MSNKNEIRLKITIDGKDAVGTIQLTDEEIKQLGLTLKKVSNESDNASRKIVSLMRTSFNQL